MKKAIILMVVLLAFTFATTVSANNHQVKAVDTNCQTLSASPLDGPEDPPPPPPENKKHHKHKPKNPPPDNQTPNNPPPENQPSNNPPPQN